MSLTNSSDPDTSVPPDPTDEFVEDIEPAQGVSSSQEIAGLFAGLRRYRKPATRGDLIEDIDPGCDAVTSTDLCLYYGETWLKFERWLKKEPWPELDRWVGGRDLS